MAGSTATAILLIAFLFVLYFLPSFIAKSRHHQQTEAITVLNLLLGWTVLGWIIAMVWAHTAVMPASKVLIPEYTNVAAMDAGIESKAKAVIIAPGGSVFGYDRKSGIESKAGAIVIALIVLLSLFIGYMYIFGKPDTARTTTNDTPPIEEPVAEPQAVADSPNSAEPTKQGENLNYSLPIYTSSGAVVCPFSSLLEKREDKGLKAATDAAISIFGRSEAIQKAGCEEWKEGIRLYISESEKGNTWQEATLFPGGATNKLVFEPYLTNKGLDAAVESPTPEPVVQSTQQSSPPQPSSIAN